MALGWQRNVTALPGHRELAVAAEIMLGFFGREQLVSLTLCLKCGSGHAPSQAVAVPGVGRGQLGPLWQSSHCRAPQPRMWAKLHLLNKTLQFSRQSQSYLCGNSLKKPVGRLSGGCGLVQLKH